MKNQALLLVLSLCSLFCAAQESAVVPLGHNFLYRGVDNPVKILAEDYPCDDLIINSNMKYVRSSRCSYYVVPMNQHSGMFRIHALQGGDTVFIGQHEFRLLTTPDPFARINGSWDGRISIGQLLEARGIQAKLDDFLYDTKFEVTSFTALLKRGENVLYKEDIRGERWTTSLEAKIRELGPGDQVLFESIKAKGPAGIERALDPLELQLR